MAETSQELHGKWPVVGRQIVHMAETSLGKGSSMAMANDNGVGRKPAWRRLLRSSMANGLSWVGK